VRLLRAGQYQAALDKWDQVQARDPQYPDRDKIEATARKKQAAQAEPTGWRRLPRWAWAAIAGLALLVAVVITVFVVVPAITLRRSQPSPLHWSQPFPSPPGLGKG